MKPWLRFLRVGLLPTALSNLLVGMALAAPGPLQDLALAPALGAAACLYLFGMGLNDLRDRKRDEIGAPDRPLPSGQITVGAAGAALVVLFGSSLLLATIISIPALIAAATVLATILLYDLWLKDSPVLGPLTMGSVRFCLVLFGGVVAADGFWPPRAVWLAAAGVGGYVTFLTLLSLEEERARPSVLRYRARLVTTCVVLVCGTILYEVRTDRDGLDWLLAVAAWLPLLLWTQLVALSLLEGNPPQPQRCTYRLLQGLFALDLGLLVSYDRLWIAGISVALWFWAAWGFPIRARS